MAFNLLQKYNSFKQFYQSMGLSLSFPMFIAIMTGVALLGVVLSISAGFYLPASTRLNTPIVSLVVFIAITSLVISIPFTLRNKRIDHIENSLPDSLKHMSLVLKSGGTTETALEEVSGADYGPISDDLKIALKEMKEGRTFDEAFMQAAQRSGSELYVRIASIIVDARKAGAGLSDVMNAIAEDARDVQRIKRERQSRTTMQVTFLLVSSLLLAPFIFGFAISIVDFMSKGLVTSGAAAAKAITVPELASQDAGLAAFLALSLNSLAEKQPIFAWRAIALDQILILFTIIQSIVSTTAISLIRNGKPFKYAMYMPLAVMMVIFVYIIGKTFSNFIVGA